MVVVPVGMTSVILVEPGVSITHAAVKLCADQGTLLIWVGEAGVRLYSAGQPGGASGERILYQASLRLDPRGRIEVARRLYTTMFGDVPPPANDIEKLRGIEGARVKKLYVELAADVGLPWEGRERAALHVKDALGFATSTLYGIAEAVILAAGFSPAIGFIHSGDPRSLAYDLADTVKFKTVVPAAFAVAAESSVDVRNRVRRRCRDLFRETRMVDTLFDTLHDALAVA